MAAKTNRIPPRFQEWAAALLRIEVLADAACHAEGCALFQYQSLRKIVAEARKMRDEFLRQSERAK